MKGCTCLEVFGEDHDCQQHGVNAVIGRLRDLAAAKHDDLSVADEAADLLEWFMETRAGSSPPPAAPPRWK